MRLYKFESKYRNSLSPDISNKFHSSRLLPNTLSQEDDLCQALDKLVLNYATTSTWSKHCSAWNLYKKFCNVNNISSVWPADVKTIRAFTVWALSVKKLKPTTVKSYLSSIAIGHDLRDLPHTDFLKDRIVIMSLKGAENIEPNVTQSYKCRLSVNPGLICIFGHRLNISCKDELLKQAVWAACLTSFFTSCRMGELIPSQSNGFNDSKILKWGNIRFLPKNEAVIFVQYTKTRGYKGDFIDIFPFPKSNYCPSSNLLKLRSIQKQLGIGGVNDPVFGIGTSSILSMHMLNEMLNRLLKDFCVNENFSISCHSFRASLPTIIESLDDSSYSNLIKEWGRWSSIAFVSYTKNVRDRKRILFNKLCSVLINVLL